MIRLNIITEGQTEQRFAKNNMQNYLQKISISARCVETSRTKNKIYRGGLNRYGKVKKDIQRWLKEDQNPDCYLTTMFDLYGLPCDFPGYAESLQSSNPYDRVVKIEEAFKKDINSCRFIPYIQLHEFESLIFADPGKLISQYFDVEHSFGIKELVNISKNCNPEEINSKNPPSKRILQQIPQYEKVGAGVEILENIGFESLRNKCRHFDEWISKLENLNC